MGRLVLATDGVKKHLGSFMQVTIYDYYAGKLLADNRNVTIVNIPERNAGTSRNPRMLAASVLIMVDDQRFQQR